MLFSINCSVIENESIIIIIKPNAIFSKLEKILPTSWLNRGREREREVIRKKGN